MPRRVQQVEHAAGVLERHHRGDDGDAALALDAHPVGAGAPPFPLRPHVPGKLDRPAGAQQVLGQRGLAGVRVGDDREGAAAGDLGGELGGRVGHAVLMRKRRAGTRRCIPSYI